MKRVRPLTKEETQVLEHEYKNGRKHHFRIRCQVILLSSNNSSVAQISNQLKKGKDAIYNWISNYNSAGIEGLKNKRGQGVKAKLNTLSEADKKVLKKAVDNEPQNLNKVCALLRQFKVTIVRAIFQKSRIRYEVKIITH